MSNENASLTEDSLISQIKEKFKTPDSFPRLVGCENEFIWNEKASLLIYQSILNKEINSFIGSPQGICNGIAIYKLKNPIRIYRNFNYDGTDYRHEYLFDRIYIKTSQEAKEPNNSRSIYNNDGYYGLYLNLCSLCDHLVNKSNNFYAPDRYLSNPFEAEIFRTTKILEDNLNAAIDEARLSFSRSSLFDLCKDLTIHKTPKDVFNFLSNSDWDPNPYKTKKSYSSSITCRYFLEDSANSPEVFKNLKECNPNCSEEDLVRYLLNDYAINRRSDFSITSFFEKTYKNFKQVFSFKNEDGKVIQKVIKQLAFDNQGKFYVPMTAWTRDKFHGYDYYCVPVPEEQPLYNLNELSNNEFKAIILTDSLDIADLNQAIHSPTACYLSWLPCSIEFLDVVNFEPLKNRNEPFYYLLCNHSGNSIEEEYQKSKPIIDYLKEKVGLNFKVIQIELKHINAKKFINNLSELIKNKPEVLNDSVQIMSLEEFEANRKKAEAEINRASLPFYIRALGDNALQESMSSDIKSTDNQQQELDRFLIRPGIYQGQLNLIWAPPDEGKTSFAYSILASVIKSKNLFENKLWISTKSDKPRKALYFDFELRPEYHDHNLETYAYPYFDGNKKEKRVCADKYLKYIDCKSLNSDLTQLSNHQQIIDTIEREKHEFPDDKIEVVVFDSLKAITNTLATGSWSKLKPMFDDLKSLGITIIILHHATKDKSDIAGSAEIERDCQSIIHLNKENKHADLSDNILLELKSKGGLGFEKEPFYMHFVHDKGWLSRSKKKVDNVEDLIRIIQKAVVKKGLSEDAKLEIERFKFEKYDEILSVAGDATKSNMNESEIRGKIDALNLADDDYYSYLQEFVEFSSYYRKSKKTVNQIYPMLGIGKTKYHETINDYILAANKKNVDSKVIAEKIGWMEKEVNDVIKKPKKS